MTGRRPVAAASSRPPTAVPATQQRPLDTAAVLRWGMPRLRDLPWRATRDPWAVLVSEVMLQQTQVARVVPKWHAFLDAFPTTAACAAAPLGDVLRLWQGLGYPRRARNLHAAATAIEAAGAFPDSLDELLALPGVGQYTARAVLAFAFEHPAAVVDTNIARILARVAGRRLTAREAQAAADASLERDEPWAWNQCLMDLGATVCTASSPDCVSCPLRRGCAWRGRGDDPAPGSAGVSRAQGRFDGSDRQARGRLLRRLGEGARRWLHRAGAGV
ncbi:MAG: A/G-specific adenine glycosylase, partial [Ilumatobacteraceae bacterium]